jgi:hypothetical protein
VHAAITLWISCSVFRYLITLYEVVSPDSNPVCVFERSGDRAAFSSRKVVIFSNLMIRF